MPDMPNGPDTPGTPLMLRAPSPQRPPVPTFPTLDETTLRERLAPPRAGARHRVVLDTDAANEIDDPFAIAWALLAPERLKVQACLAAPFSFEHRRHEVLRARRARDRPDAASAEDHELLRLHAGKLAFWEQRGWDPATLALPSFCTPAEGMQRSVQAIEAVYTQLGLPHAGRVFAGSTRYLRSLAEPERSAATDALIALASGGWSGGEAGGASGGASGGEGGGASGHESGDASGDASSPVPDDGPLYVLAIGCLTNVANALLLEPELVRRLVVVWTAGYPTHAPHANRAFNLEQDRLAAQLVFDSGVPLVYLPGYHVGAQLRLSLPEMERHVRGAGAIGAHLHELYTHNPLWPLVGIERAEALHPQHASSWVIWDLINVAWMLEPAWVPSELVRTPRLGDDLRWQRGEADAGRPWMREAHAVQRDAIFSDFFARLRRAP
jgi:hypothetical protein